MPHEDGTMHVRDAEVDFLAFLGLPVTDTNIEQLRVYGQAMRIFHERDPKYGSLWKQYPTSTHLVHMDSKLARTKANVDEDDLDDAIDLLNYTVFFIRVSRDQLLPPA